MTENSEFLTLHPLAGRQPSPEAVAYLNEQRETAKRWLLSGAPRFSHTKRRSLSGLFKDYAASLANGGASC